MMITVRGDFMQNVADIEVVDATEVSHFERSVLGFSVAHIIVRLDKSSGHVLVELNRNGKAEDVLTFEWSGVKKQHVE